MAEGAPPAACTATDTALPAPMAGWTAKTEMVSAGNADGLAKASLQVGKGVVAELHPTREVAYVVQPEKPGGSVAHGGMLSLTIDQAGAYQVAIDSGAWIDLYSGVTVMRSGAHGRGPECSSIRKMVAFDLQPGRYVLQISANADPKIAVMVARQP